MTAEEQNFRHGSGRQRRESRGILDGVGEAGPMGASYAVYGMLIYLTYITGKMNMGVSRVTDKFQVTIPKDVRESVGLRPGEQVTVEGAPGGAIIVKRFETVKDPLTVLIGKRPLFRKPLSSEKLEDLSEER